MRGPGGCHGSCVAAGELSGGRRERVMYMAHLSQTPEEADPCRGTVETTKVVMGTWARGEVGGPHSLRASLPPRVRVEVSGPVQAWLSEKLPPQMPFLARVGRALGEGGSVLARPPSIGTSHIVYTAGVRHESKGSWDETS